MRPRHVPHKLGSTPRSGTRRAKDLLALTFETNPLSKVADSVLLLRMEPVEVCYLPSLIARLGEFFRCVGEPACLSYVLQRSCLVAPIYTVSRVCLLRSEQCLISLHNRCPFAPICTRTNLVRPDMYSVCNCLLSLHKWCPFAPICKVSQ